MKRVVVVLAMFVLLVVSGGSAQEPQVSIRYYGQSFFLVTAPDGTRVALDPYGQIGYPPPTVSGDVVLITHEHGDHNNAGLVQGARRVLRGLTADRAGWNKIYEHIGSVTVKAIPSFHDNEGGTSQRGLNTIFVVETGGLRIVQMGDIGQASLTTGQIQAIGSVDVLMIPVGGAPFTTGAAEATAITAQLRPRIVIPMHYKTSARPDWPGVDEQAFLAGKTNVVRTGNTLTLSAGRLPAPTQIAVMEWRQEP
jgi:L-ascorbate metabolism protein UlaG (beta-lactamase superfamily)